MTEADFQKMIESHLETFNVPEMDIHARDRIIEKLRRELRQLRNFQYLLLDMVL